MKTPFLNLELMSPNQLGKEIVFNETIVQLEQFCSQMVIKFTHNIYQELPKALYIISKEGDKYHNHLAYFLNKWKYIAPKENMIIFIGSENSFFKFSDNKWQKIEFSSKIAEANITTSKVTAEEKTFDDAYIGITGTYNIPTNKDFLHLYITGNVTINIKNHNSKKLSLLIKQNHQKEQKINWSGNIIFKDEELTLPPNNLVIIDLYRTPENDRYLAHIKGIYQ